MKKYIRYWLPFSLFLLVSFISQAQSLSDETRLILLENKLIELSRDSTAKGLQEIANFSVSNSSLQDFLRAVAETHSLNITIDPTLDAKITNNFNNAKVINLILLLCREYKLDIRFTGNILSFVRYVPPPEVKPVPVVRIKEVKVQYNPAQDLLSMDLSGDTLQNVVKKIIQQSKKNIVLSPGITNNIIHGYVESLPFEVALDKIGYANGLRLFKSNDKTYTFYTEEVNGSNNNTKTNLNVSNNTIGDGNRPGNNNSSITVQVDKEGEIRVSIDAVNIAIAELINAVSIKAKINYAIYGQIAGNTTLKIENVKYSDFLSFLLRGTTHTFKNIENIYLIGDRSLEGIRVNKVVRLQFRPVTKIDEVIPAELKKGVEVKLFPELNSLILTGSNPQITEISEFIKAIDQPVVNVLIEVLVVDIRKGYSIKTGIKAFLGDSTVKTGGQVFPGVDLTLGSKAINDFLGKLDARGYINLGRVTPNFYLQLQALEDNNYLNVRSTPKLSTLNGHEADLTIGRSEYYLEQTQNIIGGVNSVTSVSQQYKKVEANLSIKINPAVSGNDDITLGITAEFSDFVAATVRGAPPGNATRKFNSMIRIRNEEMIVLGGLEEARREKGSSGVPLLSRIPILKWLFSSRTDAKSNNKLIIFIKPTIVY